MLNTDTSLLRTACSVAGEKKHLHVLFKFNPLRIGTFYDPLSLRINGVWLCNYYALLYSNPTKTIFRSNYIFEVQHAFFWRIISYRWFGIALGIKL